MSAASVLIQLWRRSLVQTFRASDIASSRRIKLEVLFHLGLKFQKISAASVLVQLWRGSLVQTHDTLM
jgi:hypothetical protein